MIRNNVLRVAALLAALSNAACAEDAVRLAQQEGPTLTIIGEGPDSDLDGLSDEMEERLGTNPSLADTDRDGIVDGEEVVRGLDPRERDSDGDGLDDGTEILEGTDPSDSDTDNDGLSDGEELDYGTDPDDKDSDGDGIGDGDEVDNGTDPLDGLGDDTEPPAWNGNPDDANEDGTPADDEPSNDSDDEFDASLWDWGDGSNTDCTGCDPANFAGEYSAKFEFFNVQQEKVICQTQVKVTVDEKGMTDVLSVCTLNSGLEFVLNLQLEVSFASKYASPTYGCLAGTGSFTLPSGDVIQASFPPTACLGGINLTTTQYYPCSLAFQWRPIIETPSGPVEYGIILTACNQ